MGEKLDRVLLVRGNWGELILQGIKPWEMRSAKTNVRGRIGIAFSGTKKIFGSVTLVDSLEPIEYNDFNLYFNMHRIPASERWIPEKYKFPWVMALPTIYTEPMPYKHPPGAVIWVMI